MTKRSHTAGLPPGTLVHIGEKKVEKTKVPIIDYDEAQFQEKEAKTIEECLPFKAKPTVNWINIDGVHEVETIEKIGRHFDLHPLLLEDIVNTEQRPKMEGFGDYIFVVLKGLSYDEQKKRNKNGVDQFDPQFKVRSFFSGGWWPHRTAKPPQRG